MRALQPVIAFVLMFVVLSGVSPAFGQKMHVVNATYPVVPGEVVNLTFLTPPGNYEGVDYWCVTPDAGGDGGAGLSYRAMGGACPEQLKITPRPLRPPVVVSGVVDPSSCVADCHLQWLWFGGQAIPELIPERHHISVVVDHSLQFKILRGTGEQTQEQCLDDAGVSGIQGRRFDGQWDPKVGQCIAMDPVETREITRIIDAGGSCAKALGVSGFRALDETDKMIADCIRAVLRKTTQLNALDNTITVAGVILSLAAVLANAPAIGTGIFVVTFVYTAGRATGILPQDHIARALRELLNRLGDNVRPFAGIQASRHDWVKLQSTNPDALLFSFEGDSLRLNYNRVEPTEFVWTLMSNDTPVGSLVTPYVPGPPPDVPPVRVTASFTDDPLVPGVPIKAVHFMELRERIDVLLEEAGLGQFSWTDPVLQAGVTPVMRVHLRELRSALAAAYVVAGRAAPRWTDASPPAGTTPIRAAHVTELRAAVLALE